MEKKMFTKATRNEIIIELQQLKDAFAERPDAFWKLLFDMIAEKNFFLDAVKNGIRDVIYRCSYHQLSIGEVLKAIGEANSKIIIDNRGRVYEYQS